MTPDAPDSHKRLLAALAQPEPDLVEAALAIAADEYPELDEGALQDHLDALADEVRARIDPAHPLQALTAVLGADHGFRGNVSAYGDPRNAFLNEVLTLRVGIPISLSLVYQEVARRAGLAVHGIAFPGHFLVGNAQGVLDPFHGGRRLQPSDLRRLLARTAPQVSFSPRLLHPASSRQIVVRMLTNLEHIYVGAGDWPRALRVVELLLAVAPDHPGELRVRARVRQSLGAYAAALADVQHCMALSPHAPDAVQLRWTAQVLARRAGWQS